MRSGAPRCAPWLAERRPPRGLGPALTFFGPSWDQGLVGAGQAAQFGHGLSLPLILRAFVLAGAECEAGGLGQQVGAVACDLSQFRRSSGLLRLGQAAPSGMPPGGAVKRGSPQPVRARSGAVPSHLPRIEHGDDKGKLAAFVSACRAAGKAMVMQALTPASPDSLPPLGELIADEPFWQYPASLEAGAGVAHLRVWLTRHPEPGHLAVVTETGSAAEVTQSAAQIRAELERRYGPSLVLLEHDLAPEAGEGTETLDLVRIGADGSPHWLRIWPSPQDNPRHAGLEAWMAAYGQQIVSQPASAFDWCEGDNG